MEVVGLARQTEKGGRRIPGGGKHVCKGPEEEAQHDASDGHKLTRLKHRIGVGERRALFSAIPPGQATLRCFYSSVITTSRN